MSLGKVRTLARGVWGSKVATQQRRYGLSSDIPASVACKRELRSYVLEPAGS
jgi:hypothetical protein